MDKFYLTTGDVCTRFGVTSWQARRAVDSLGERVPRAGLYRLVPLDLLPAVEAELRRRGYLCEREVACA